MLRQFVRNEIIGLPIEIIGAKNPSLVGLKGMIIDETQNTITIKIKKLTKKLIKNQIKMKIKFNNEEITLDGSALVGRPEERIKK